MIGIGLGLRRRVASAIEAFFGLLCTRAGESVGTRAGDQIMWR